MQNWTEQKIQKVKELRQRGWSYKDIAKCLAVTSRSISYVINRRHLVSNELTKKLIAKNSVRGHQLKERERFWGLLRQFRYSPQVGWMVGLLNISGRCNNGRFIYFSATDSELVSHLAGTISQFTKNKVSVFEQKFYRGVICNTLFLIDKVFARFIAHLGGLFLRRWRGKKIRQYQLDYLKCLIAGVFDSRAYIRASGGRIMALRLYLAKLPPGAVHNIKIVLRRLGIKYSMQGAMSRGERAFYKKVERRLARLELDGLSQFKGDKLIKRIFTNDYKKRRRQFSHTPALKIQNHPKNLARLGNLMDFHRSDLKRGFAKLKEDVERRFSRKNSR